MKILFTLIILIIASSSMAEDCSGEKKDSDFCKGFEEGKRALEKELVLKPSEENRDKKKFQTTIGFGYDYSALVSQLNLGAFISQNDLVSLRYGFVDKEKLRSSQVFQQQNISLQHKKFKGNSFYLAQELAYLKKATIPEDSSIDEKFTKVSYGLRIGNQWQWQNYTMGFDWVGVGASFWTLSGSGDNFNISLLNFYLGASF